MFIVLIVIIGVVMAMGSQIFGKTIGTCMGLAVVGIPLIIVIGLIALAAIPLIVICLPVIAFLAACAYVFTCMLGANKRAHSA